VSLRNARIGGRATFYGARIEPVNGARAFDGQGLHVEQSLHFSDRFSATGPIRLSDARLGDAVVISSPHIGQTPGADLVLWRATARTLHLELERPAHGRIVLNGVTVERLTDTPDAWPEEPGRVQISGFTYQYMGSSEPMTVEQRLQWLRNSVPEYAPQPYEQLASAFRAVGEDENARAVLLAKQRHRRTTLSFAGRLWGHLQDVTIGYGYRPARALGWLVALIALGTALFAADPPPPIKADEVPHWNPFFYTLDLLIPVVSLGQETAWKPSGVGQAVAYTLVLIGWVLAGAAAAGATRVLNRQ
jgi:hypothetical protein